MQKPQKLIRFYVLIYAVMYFGQISIAILRGYTDKKLNQIFLKEIQKGAVAKSYMTNGLLIYGEIFAPFLIYDFATAPL
jgi:hypothetical protein